MKRWTNCSKLMIWFTFLLSPVQTMQGSHVLCPMKMDCCATCQTPELIADDHSRAETACSHSQNVNEQRRPLDSQSPDECFCHRLQLPQLVKVRESKVATTDADVRDGLTLMVCVPIELHVFRKVGNLPVQSAQCTCVLLCRFLA